MIEPTKRTYAFLGLFFLFVVLHNFASWLIGSEEAVFFLLSLASGAGFAIALIFYTLVFIKTGQPKDWWKTGWLGLLGLAGFLPGFGAKYFGLYGLFGLFGLRRGK